MLDRQLNPPLAESSFATVHRRDSALRLSKNTDDRVSDFRRLQTVNTSNVKICRC